MNLKVSTRVVMKMMLIQNHFGDDDEEDVGLELDCVELELDCARLFAGL